MKYVGSVTEKDCTPFVKLTFLAFQKTYVKFPLFEETDYQKTRFYPDDILREFDARIFKPAH